MTRTSPTDPLDDEIRRALTREAAEPAPDRLVDRVAAMRRSVAPEWWLLARLRALFLPRNGAALRVGFALVAVAAVAVAAGILVRGVGPGPSVGGPSPAGSPGTSAPSPAASPSPAAPPAAPTATPAASAAPSAASSAAASPSRAPGAGPVGGPVPAGFEPRSVTFVSASDGWVLGSATCAGQPCAAIVRTTDGGRTWESIPAPGATINNTATGPSGGVSGLRFADTLDGWAFGPDLWATHDGGSTWRKVTLPAATADIRVWALEAAAGRVHAAYDGGGGGAMIATSAAGADAWTASPTTVDFGAGPVPSPQLVLHGTSGWLVEVDRTVIGGARLLNGAWSAWQPPCRDANGPALLAAASAGDLVAACDVGVWSTPTGVHLYVSADGGKTFSEAAAKVPVLDVQAVAEPAPSTVFVAGSLSGIGSAIVASADGGRTWAAVHVANGARFTYLGFTTVGQGVAITSPENGAAELLMTRDGGRTWAPVAFK